MKKKLQTKLQQASSFSRVQVCKRDINKTLFYYLFETTALQIAFHDIWSRQAGLDIFKEKFVRIKDINFIQDKIN